MAMNAANFMLRSVGSKALDALDIVVRSIKQPDVRCDISCGVRRTVFQGSNSVYARSRVINAKVGKYTYFAPDCMILNASIGAFCSIGPGVAMGLGRHPSRGWFSTSPSFYSPGCQAGDSFVDTLKFQETAPVIIGNDVWIGARAIIADSVVIGDGAIIGAGAIVTDTVPPFAVIAGIPGKLLRYRYSEEIIERLLKVRWWNWEDQWLRRAAPFFEHGSEASEIVMKLSEIEALAKTRTISQ